MSQKLHLHCLIIPVEWKVYKQEPDGDEDSEVVIVIDERNDADGDGPSPGPSGVKGE